MRPSLSRLEILRLYVQRQFMDFLLRKHRFGNFLIGLLLGVIYFLRGIIAAPRLNAVLLFPCQRDLNGVVPPVHLLILRRKTEHVGNFRGGAQELQSPG